MSLQLQEVLNRSVLELLPKREIIKCTPETTVLEAVKLLQDSGIGSLLVMNQKQAVGIFTERDYLMKVAGKEGVLGQKQVTSFMTVNPMTISRHESVAKALGKMCDGKFRHIVIIDSYNNVENIISMRDIVEFLVKSLKELISTG